MIKLILNYLAGDSRFPDFTKIESIRSAIERDTPPSLSLDIGGGIRFHRTYDRLDWTRSCKEQDGKQTAQAYTYELARDNSLLELPEAMGVLRADYLPVGSKTDLRSGGDRNEAYFDADLLRFPLVVRSRKNGDRIEPIGVIGSKKVKDMFIDLKINPEWRDRMPIIVNGADQILWIPGIRRSRHALLSDQTANVVRLRFETIRR